MFELMIMNDDLRDMIVRNASTDDLRDKARSYGMVTLRDAGMDGRLRRHDHGRRSRPRDDCRRLKRQPVYRRKFEASG